MEPLIYAHRGASKYAPENTMAAFIKGVEMGAGGIELDVRLTKDGHVVIIHDDTVKRTSNGQGNVRDMSLEQLKALDFGSWFSEEFKGEKILTLEEAMKFAAIHNLMLNVELKALHSIQRELVEKVEKIVMECEMVNQTIVSCFNHGYIKEMKAINPKVKTGMLYTAAMIGTLDYALVLGASNIHPNYEFLDEYTARDCKKAGIGINVWTVDHEKDVKRMIELGVNGIITNTPDTVLQVMKSLFD
jgi:glycerophosphoryl diester phosphodiesterase